MRALKYSYSTNDADADADSESSPANTPIRVKKRSAQPRKYLKSSSAVVPATSTSIVGINNGDIVDVDAISKPDKSIIVPHPPTLVQAIGGDAYAVVWWPAPVLKGILSYEIARYKMDKNGQWKYTGSSTHHTPNITKYIIPNLENGNQYRFTVYASNIEGRSKESHLSPSCLIEAPLPNGWFRTLDTSKNSYYYYNLECNKVSWSRPDCPNPQSTKHADRYFIDESIYRVFSDREIDHLIDIFEEEMLHFEKVTKERLRELLLECGEDVSLRDCSLLLREFSESSTAFSVQEIITNYHVFLDLMAAVKRRATTFRLLTSLFRSSGLVASVGEYDILYSDVALRYNISVSSSKSVIRNYVKHRTSGVKTWHIPREVRLYISEELSVVLDNTCDPLETDIMRNTFLHLDGDCEGHVVLKELIRYIYIMSYPSETAAEVTKPAGKHRAVGVLPATITATIKQDIFKRCDQNGSGRIEYADFVSLLLHFRNNRPALQDLFQILPSLKTYEINKTSLSHSLETYLLAKKNKYYESETVVVVEEKSFLQSLCCFMGKPKAIAVPTAIDDSSGSSPPAGTHGKKCFCGCRIAIDYSGAGLY